MTLVQMTPEAVAASWDGLAEQFEKAMPELLQGTNSKRRLTVLDSVMKKRSQVWVAQGDGDKVLGYALTTFQYDPILFSKNLFIYAVVSFNNDVDFFRDGLDALKRFAQANNCLVIGTFTKEKSVSMISKSLGGKLLKYIYFEVI